jgi:hypothetical protein
MHPHKVGRWMGGSYVESHLQSAVDHGCFNTQTGKSTAHAKLLYVAGRWVLALFASGLDSCLHGSTTSTAGPDPLIRCRWS